MLIESLIEYRKRKGYEITVVFDGWKTGEANESHSIVGGVKIIYSRLGEKADSVIKRIISKSQGWIVVTSDRDIIAHAWASGSIPITSEDFLNAIERRQVEVEVEYENNDEYIKSTKKGSSRRLSKKEKAIKRALSKL